MLDNSGNRVGREVMVLVQRIILPTIGAASITAREAPTRKARRQARRDRDLLLRLDEYVARVVEAADRVE